MKPSLHPKRMVSTFVLILFLLLSRSVFSQTETFAPGSFIVNMGATNPNTIGNGLKPYGLMYDLVRNYNVPMKLVISQTKAKDGIDFTYNGVQYKGGSFIIQAQYRTAAVNNRITYWTGQGVVGSTTTSSLTLNVTRTVTSYPKWTLDAQNGKIAEGFLINAGITNTAFPGAYNWKAPALLDGCDDYFVMPHADPLWSSHGRLWSWNKDCLGAIWAGCHAVSVLENMSNPSNPAQKTNFLSTTGLLLFGSHGNGSVPYTHQYPTDPVAQYMGKTDLAMLNGSEQIFMPKPGGAWNPGVKIIAYDPTQANVPANSPGAAVLIAYGRGMDDPNRGYVVYEAAHSINKGTAGDVAAQRAFFNFSFYNAVIKNPILTVTGITEGQQVQSGQTLTALNVLATSPVSNSVFTYQWSASCGGSFSNPTGATTNFTVPVVGSNTNCVITCKVTDQCGRSTFKTYIIIIIGAVPPSTVNDAQSLDPGCGAASITYNVLANDTEPNGQPMTLTSVTGVANGTVSFTAAGNITYTCNAGFVGVETLTYTVCDNTTPVPLCSNGTYTITVGNIANLPNAVNDAFTIAEDIAGTFNVLANDLPLVSGPLTVSAISVAPANGKASINTNNTITYVPNTDFAGTDNFTYRLVNSLGYSKTATVTITVTNNSCDGGTYESVPPSGGTINPNPTIDSYLSEQNTGRNYGNCTTLLVDGQNGARAYRGLLKFDVSSIPANAIINSASLSLTATAVQSANPFSIDVHRMTRDWTEGAQCNTNGTPNWNDYSAGNPWTALGGDYNATVRGTTSVSTTGSYNWTITSLVQEWVNGTSSNFGMLMKFNNEATANEQKTFGSVENATAGNRPVLTVNYTIPAVCLPIPTRAPLAMPDTANTVNGVPVNIPTALNDYFPVAGAVTYSIVTPPVSGTASINGSGVINYTPSGSFNGVRTITYQVTHTASGLTDQAIVYINITNAPIDAVNDAPAGASSGLVQTINVKANDTDPEGQVATAAVTITSPPSSGTATVNGSGNIVYTPNAGFTGTDTLYYSLCEPAPACGSAFCDTARVVVTVLNRPPTPGDDTKTILPCNAVTINIINNDTDPEGNALTVTNISALNPPAAGTVTNNNDGTVTFIPATGFTGVVTFTYTVTDDGIPPLTSAPATVTITVAIPVNNAPVAVNDADTTNMDQKLYENVLDNDYDPDDNPLTIPVITVAPLHGTAVVNPLNGLIEYTPNPGYFGDDILTYRICDILTLNVATCAPGPGLCTTATLSVHIDIPNSTNAINDQNSTWINMPVSGGVLVNDFDIEGDAISFTGFIDAGGLPFTSGTIILAGTDFNGVAVPNAGSLAINSNGTYIFTPANGFTGTATVAYTTQDGRDDYSTDTAILKITVNPLKNITNSVISTNDENITYGNPVSGNVLVNDRDPQGDAFAVTGFTYDTNGDGTPDGTGVTGTPVITGGITVTGKPVSNAGTFMLNTNGAYSFTPAADFHGQADIYYSICDNGAPAACSRSVLHIDVLPDINGAQNDAPFTADDFIHTAMNVPVNGNFVSNDNDPNGDNLSINGVTINTGGALTLVQTLTTLKNGSVAFYADGTYTYSPPFNYMGPDQLVYQLCDVTGVAPQPRCTNGTLYFLISNGTLLPINLLSFNGKRVGKDNLLQWSTAQETNSRHFEIENSKDNSVFSMIGKVAAKGNSSIQSNYSFVHNNPVAGVNYYRLKLVDLDGKFSYSKIVAIRGDGTGVTLNTVYPNPFRDKIELAITTNSAGKANLLIYDLSGKLVLSREAILVKGLNVIPLTGLDKLSSGTYFLDVNSNGDILKTKLFKTN